MFKIIGGTDGSSSGDMVLSAIFGYLIEPQFLKTISWTGKSDSKLKKKVKFESFSEIIGLICEVCNTADENYSDVQCKKDMVYKIFKYAYRIKSDSESVNDAKENEAGNHQSNTSNNNNQENNQQQWPASPEIQNLRSSNYQRLQAAPSTSSTSVQCTVPPMIYPSHFQHVQTASIHPSVPTYPPPPIHPHHQFPPESKHSTYYHHSYTNNNGIHQAHNNMNDFY